jgi:hypothetical protein
MTDNNTTAPERDYEYSRLLDVHRWSDYPEVNGFIGKLAGYHYIIPAALNLPYRVALHAVQQWLFGKHGSNQPNTKICVEFRLTGSKVRPL